jgi:hypothetical protein
MATDIDALALGPDGNGLGLGIGRKGLRKQRQCFLGALTFFIVDSVATALLNITTQLPPSLCL